MRRGRTERDLINMGIVDQVSKDQRRQSTTKGDSGGGGGRRSISSGRDEWIFQATELRRLLMRLLCTVDASKPPNQDDRLIFAEFDYIEGQPYVCTDEMQANTPWIMPDRA